MSTTRAVWFFIIALTAIRLSMLATTDLEFDEPITGCGRSASRAGYFSKGPAIAFFHSRHHFDFRRERVRRAASSVRCSQEEQV